MVPESRSVLIGIASELCPNIARISALLGMAAEIGKLRKEPGNDMTIQGGAQ
jgi:hypothetical protein